MEILALFIGGPADGQQRVVKQEERNFNCFTLDTPSSEPVTLVYTSVDASTPKGDTLRLFYLPDRFNPAQALRVLADGYQPEKA